jgi:cytochrome c oxidase accessory protein FixG
MPTSLWHRLRKRIHLVCFFVFLALPFLNVVRFDIPRQRFYFFGAELWISEFGIIFFALMFLMFLIVISSIFFGRVYCSYLCPQMIFSEASMAVESWWKRRIAKKFPYWSPALRRRSARAMFYVTLAPGAVFLAFVFIAYFVEPVDLARRLFSLDAHTAGGIAGATVTLLTFADFAFLRLGFCKSVCPYGYLQGIMGDGNTLLVHYRDQTHECIECKKCVRVCPMEIDIRNGPFQIECVHCGECIDACDEVLARLKQPKPGLIHYAWGEKGELLTGAAAEPWYRRIGIRDAKRVVVILITAFYAAGLGVAFSMRHPVLVQISPERGQDLYRVGSDGQVYNRFRFAVANRRGRPSAVLFSLRFLPAAHLIIAVNPVGTKPGETSQGFFEIAQPAGSTPELVTHFEILASTIPDGAVDSFPMTFLAPGQGPAHSGPGSGTP